MAKPAKAKAKAKAPEALPTLEELQAEAKEMAARLKEIRTRAKALKGPRWLQKTEQVGEALVTILGTVQPETAALVEKFVAEFGDEIIPSLDMVVQHGMSRIMSVRKAAIKRAAKQN